MRYLVTGGAGFIGSHLVERLLADGHDVAVVDDLSTGSVANLRAVRAHPRLRLELDSIFNERLMAELVDDCDLVFHLAAAVGVRLIVEQPVRTIETNIGGTEVVFRHAAKKGRPVVLASTSEVYGKGAQVPFSEEDDTVLGPTTKARWSYACSKLIDEFLALSYHKERRVPVIVVRLFNTVGPRQTGRYGMVLPRFVAQALRGGPLTVYGDGTQSRCFAYVGDVVDAMIRLTREPRAYGRIFNLGSDREITIRRLAEMVVERVRPGTPIVHVPYHEAYEAGFEDLPRRVPDLTRVRELIGYDPKTSLEQIIELVREDVAARLEREEGPAIGGAAR